MMWVANSLNTKQRERVNFGQNDDGNSASLKLPLYALPCYNTWGQGLTLTSSQTPYIMLLSYPFYVVSFIQSF